MQPQLVHRTVKVDTPEPISYDENKVYIKLDAINDLVDFWKTKYDKDAVLMIENNPEAGYFDCSILYHSMETAQEFKDRVAAEKKRLAGLEKGKKNRRELYERLKKEFEGE